MRFKSIIQSGVLFALLSSAALANPQPVPCPSADLIKGSWQKLDTVTALSDPNSRTHFIAFMLNSVTFDENNHLDWATFSVDTNTTDFNTAFTTGQNLVKDVSVQISPYAMENDLFYLCGYMGSNGRFTAFAIAEKDQAHPSSETQKMKQMLKLSH